jgi:hypothetical protein
MILVSEFALFLEDYLDQACLNGGEHVEEAV